MGADRMRVLVVDDHRTFAELLLGALEREPDFTCLGYAPTGAQALRMVEDLAPDVVVMDVELPDMDGFTVTRRIVDGHPATRVVMLTAHRTADFVARAAAAGACGFLPKDGALALMLETLRSARVGSLAIHPSLAATLVPLPTTPASGVPQLTERENQVLGLMGRGLDASAVARELGISLHTCRGYVKSILTKLGAHSQLEAVVTASKLGLLRLDDAR